MFGFAGQAVSVFDNAVMIAAAVYAAPNKPYRVGKPKRGGFARVAVFIGLYADKVNAVFRAFVTGFNGKGFKFRQRIICGGGGLAVVCWLV